MSSSPPTSLDSSLLVLALLVFFVVRRTLRVLRGAVYSAARLFAFAGFALAVFALFGSTTLYAAFGTWGPIAWGLLAPYGATVGTTVLLTEPRVREDVRFETRGAGEVYYRLSWLVPVLYLVLFIARLAVELLVLGIAPFGTVSFPSTLPTPLLVTSIAFDLLYAVSVGLLLARATGVRRAYLRAYPAARAPPAPEGNRPLP